MVKQSFFKLKFLKYLILILSVFAILGFEAHQNLDLKNIKNTIWLAQIKGDLLVDDKNQKGAYLQSQIPKEIKSQGDSAIRIHDSEIYLSDKAKILPLIINNVSAHLKLQEGQVYIKAQVYPKQLSIQSLNNMYFPLAASRFWLDKDGIQVDSGVVIVHRLNSKGEFISSKAITNSQRVGDIEVQDFDTGDNASLKNLLSLQSRSRTVDYYNSKLFLNFNEHQTVEQYLNLIRQNLQNLSSQKAYDPNLLNSILTEMAVNKSFMLQWQDMASNLVKSMLSRNDVSQFQVFLDKLLQKHFKTLDLNTKRYLLVYEVDRINVMRLRKINKGYNDAQISLLQAFDNYMLEKDYKFNHQMILVINSMLKQLDFWTPNLFEIRARLFAANLTLKKDSAIYKKDFEQQNEVILKRLLKNPSRVNKARSIADILIRDLSTEKRLNYVQKIIEL